MSKENKRLIDRLEWLDKHGKLESDVLTDSQGEYIIKDETTESLRYLPDHLQFNEE